MENVSSKFQLNGNLQSISFSFSIVFHILLIISFLLLSTGRKDYPVQHFAEVQLGGGNGMSYSGGSNETKTITTEKRKDVIFENTLNKKNITPTKTEQVSGEGSGTGDGTGDGTGSGTGDGNNLSLNIPDPNSQKTVKPESNIYLVAVDEMPEPYGGIQSILSKVVYPPEAKASGITGTVYVLAFIDEAGNVRKTLLAKGIGGGCDEAAINAVKKTRFKPGKHKGENVKVQMHIAVPFK